MGLLILRTIDVWGQMVLCCGQPASVLQGVEWHYWSLPARHKQDYPLVMTTKNIPDM